MALELVEQFLQNYVDAFAAGDAERVAEFYDLPSMFLAPWGQSVVATLEMAQGLAAQLIEHARSQDCMRTEIVDFRAESLAATLAALSGMFIRRDRAGNEVSRFGVRYVLRHTQPSWKIVVAIAHDPPGSR